MSEKGDSGQVKIPVAVKSEKTEATADTGDQLDTAENVNQDLQTFVADKTGAAKFNQKLPNGTTEEIIASKSNTSVNSESVIDSIEKVDSTRNPAELFESASEKSEELVAIKMNDFEARFSVDASDSKEIFAESVSAIEKSSNVFDAQKNPVSNTSLEERPTPATGLDDKELEPAAEKLGASVTMVPEPDADKKPDIKDEAFRDEEEPVVDVASLVKPFTPPRGTAKRLDDKVTVSPVKDTVKTEKAKSVQATYDTEKTKHGQVTDEKDEAKPVQVTDDTDKTKPVQATDDTEKVKPAQATNDTEKAKPVQATDVTEKTKPVQATDEKEKAKSVQAALEKEKISANEKKPEKEEEFLDVLGNGTLLKRIVKKGTGKRPDMGDIVVIDASFEIPEVGKTLPDRRIEYILGDGDVVQALDLTVALMLVGEKAVVIAGYKYMYGEQGDEPDIPPNSNFKITLTLLECKGPINYQPMDFETRFAEAKKKKETGNYRFKRKEYSLALQAYSKANMIVNQDMGCNFSDESPKNLQQLLEFRAIILSNTSAAQFKLEAYDAAMLSAKESTRLWPGYDKAYIRMGQAYDKMGQTENAIKSYKMALTLGPVNMKWIHGELERLSKVNKKSRQNQKDMYSKMFWGSKPPTVKETTKNTKEKSSYFWLWTTGATVLGAGLVGLAGIGIYKYLNH